MDKEKQDRFDCKHLECCMDGCYCNAGHGSIRGYGHCVIPFEQKTCKYFERKSKTKTVKITENEVVISKEEYEVLINQNKGLKEENHILRLENNDLEAQVELKKQTTAEKIYHNLIELSENPCNDREEIYKAVFEPYGVEIGEEK